MDSFPKVGMTFEQSRQRIKKYDKVKAAQLKDSLINQVELHEGEKAAAELSKEADSVLGKPRGGCNTNLINKHSANFSGLPADAWERIFSNKGDN